MWLLNVCCILKNSLKRVDGICLLGFVVFILSVMVDWVSVGIIRWVVNVIIKMYSKLFVMNFIKEIIFNKMLKLWN